MIGRVRAACARGWEPTRSPRPPSPRAPVQARASGRKGSAGGV
jgi:hypothetical protein